MSEINQKRQVKGFGRFLDDLVSMSANIVTMTRVVATAGGAISISQASVKTTRSGGLSIQKLYRKGGSKSQDSKEQEYIQHTYYLFNRIAGLADIDLESEMIQWTQISKTEKLVEATGVETDQIYRESDIAKAFKIVVDAMKKRD